MKELKEYARIGRKAYLYDEKNNLYYKKSTNSKPMRLSLFQEHFYNLRLFNNVPVLEIDGLRMQVMKGFKTPLDYSEKIADVLKIKENEKVLDTCMGLGYTAMAAAKKGAQVVAVEYSDAVIELARYNPLSAPLFESKNIDILKGDIAEKIKQFDDESFDKIIHDPPRISHAPKLYSRDFYLELKRVLKPNGEVYHYVGSVGTKKRGRNIKSEVARRLYEVGFRKTRYVETLQGIITKK